MGHPWRWWLAQAAAIGLIFAVAHFAIPVVGLLTLPIMIVTGFAVGTAVRPLLRRLDRPADPT